MSWSRYWSVSSAFGADSSENHDGFGRLRPPAQTSVKPAFSNATGGFSSELQLRRLWARNMVHRLLASARGSLPLAKVTIAPQSVHGSRTGSSIAMSPASPCARREAAGTGFTSSRKLLRGQDVGWTVHSSPPAPRTDRACPPVVSCRGEVTTERPPLGGLFQLGTPRNQSRAYGHPDVCVSRRIRLPNLPRLNQQQMKCLLLLGPWQSCPAPARL